jgi:hypothetical protein
MSIMDNAPSLHSGQDIESHHKQVRQMDVRMIDPDRMREEIMILLGKVSLICWERRSNHS